MSSMKKVTFVKTLLVIFVLFLYFPQTVSAVDCILERNKNNPECQQPTSCPSGQQYDEKTKSCVKACIYKASADGCIAGTGGETVESVQAKASTTAAIDTGGCGSTSFFGNIIVCLNRAIIGVLDFVLVGLAARGAAIAGGFLDIVLNLTVINFRDIVEGSGALNSTSGGIYAIWVFVKSIINVIIVFELLFLAIQMILGKGGFSLKQRLTQVLTFADEIIIWQKNYFGFKFGNYGNYK
jgi:hypothetical protein